MQCVCETWVVGSGPGVARVQQFTEGPGTCLQASNHTVPFNRRTGAALTGWEPACDTLAATRPPGATKARFWFHISRPTIRVLYGEESHSFSQDNLNLIETWDPGRTIKYLLKVCWVTKPRFGSIKGLVVWKEASRRGNQSSCFSAQRRNRNKFPAQIASFYFIPRNVDFYELGETGFFLLWGRTFQLEALISFFFNATVRNCCCRSYCFYFFHAHTLLWNVRLSITAVCQWRW